MSIDKYLDSYYDQCKHNCLHYVSEVWEDLTGQNIRQVLGTVLDGRIADRKLAFEVARRFKVLEKPQSPCLVFMQAPRTVPHIGIWIRGRVLHLTQQGPMHVDVDVAAVGFKSVRYALPC